MRKAPLLDATILMLCLTFALSVPARTHPSFAVSNVEDTQPAGVIDVVWDGIPEVAGRHPRLLKSSSAAGKKSNPSKSKKHKKKGKWKKGKATLCGTVIAVAAFVGSIAFCAVFIIVTEKKAEDPKWRVRDLFQRRLKPGVKRTLTRRFTRKNSTSIGDDVDMEKTKTKTKVPGDLEAEAPSQVSSK